MFNLFGKKLSDQDYHSIISRIALIQNTLKSLIENDSLKSLNFVLRDNFSDENIKSDLVNAMNELLKVLSDQKDMSKQKKIELLNNWLVSNAEYAEQPSAYNKSCVALASIMMRFALEIEIYESIKPEYQKEQRDLNLWSYVEEVAKMLSLSFSLYFNKNMQVIKEIAPQYYESYLKYYAINSK